MHSNHATHDDSAYDTAGVTIQRIGDLDRQHKGDWNGAVMPASSWGLKNAGQTDF